MSQGGAGAVERGRMWEWGTREGVRSVGECEVVAGTLTCCCCCCKGFVGMRTVMDVICF